MFRLFEPRPIVVTCARGTSSVLSDELRLLGFDPKPLDENALQVMGGIAESMRLNLFLRTAQRVLLEVARVRAPDANALHAGLVREPWEEVLHEDGYLSITGTIENATIRDPRFGVLKCKDAIVDRLADRKGRRPDSGSDRRLGAVVHLHWIEDRAIVYLDTSGEPLGRRGYRTVPLQAPMQETLAAACILHTAWRGDTAFVNPMCGSGTLAIEAALMALRRAPGTLRRTFGFQHLRGYREADWKDLVRDAKRIERSAPPAKIVASDILPGAIAAAKENAARAGVDHAIDFHACDFRETPMPPPPGVIVMNPEYGERMGDAAALEPTYRAIGDFFKQRGSGYWGYVFTGNLPLARGIGLRSKRRLTLFNANLECRLLEFELYSGTRDPGPAGSG